MKDWQTALLVTGALLAPVTVQAIDGLAIGYGEGNSEVESWRLAVVKDLHSDWLHNWSPHLDAYVDASINHWQYGDDNQQVYAISPVLTWSWNRAGSWQPFVEIGIGAAYVSDTQVEHRDLTTHFQFEDRLGVGVRRADYEFSLRAIHYSNGGIKSPNSGLSLLQANLTWRFP